MPTKDGTIWTYLFVAAPLLSNVTLRTLCLEDLCSLARVAVGCFAETCHDCDGDYELQCPFCPFTSVKMNLVYVIRNTPRSDFISGSSLTISGGAATKALHRTDVMRIQQSLVQNTI